MVVDTTNAAIAACDADYEYQPISAIGNAYIKADNAGTGVAGMAREIGANVVTLGVYGVCEAVANGDVELFSDEYWEMVGGVAGNGAIAVGLTAAAGGGRVSVGQALRRNSSARTSETAKVKANAVETPSTRHSYCGEGQVRPLDHTTSSIKAEYKNLKNGKSVKIVSDDAALQALADEWQRNGKAFTPKNNNYDGIWKELPDGTRVGLRNKSDSGGRAIDIVHPDGTRGKVHIE